MERIKKQILGFSEWDAAKKGRALRRTREEGLWLYLGLPDEVLRATLEDEQFAAPPPNPILLHPNDNQLGQAFERVSDVILKVQEDGNTVNQNIGTIARIREDGLCVGATHVWVKDGAMLAAVAFGGQVTLLASFPYYDVILLQDMEPTIEHLHRLEPHAASNIEHKDQLPLFVPVQRIMDLADSVSALPASALGYHEIAKLMRK